MAALREKDRDVLQLAYWDRLSTSQKSPACCSVANRPQRCVYTEPARHSARPCRSGPKPLHRKWGHEMDAIKNLISATDPLKADPVTVPDAETVLRQIVTDRSETVDKMPPNIRSLADARRQRAVRLAGLLTIAAAAVTAGVLVVSNLGALTGAPAPAEFRACDSGSLRHPVNLRNAHCDTNTPTSWPPLSGGRRLQTRHRRRRSSCLKAGSLWSDRR